MGTCIMYIYYFVKMFVLKNYGIIIRQSKATWHLIAISV